MECNCRECIVKFFKIAENDMNIFIGNYDIEKREYIACHANISNDLTDEQLEKLFTLGFEFVDYTVTASSKLAAIVKISDGIKGHKIDSWN